MCCGHDSDDVVCVVVMTLMMKCDKMKGVLSALCCGVECLCVCSLDSTAGVGIVKPET